jgi:hypothetical protein
MDKWMVEWEGGSPTESIGGGRPVKQGWKMGLFRKYVFFRECLCLALGIGDCRLGQRMVNSHGPPWARKSSRGNNKRGARWERETGNSGLETGGWRRVECGIVNAECEIMNRERKTASEPSLTRRSESSSPGLA